MYTLLLSALIGQWGAHGCATGPVVPSTPLYAQPAPTFALPATLRVIVEPPDAEVWIENVKMRSGGRLRLFETPPLPAGKPFLYWVRARWGDLEEKKEVQVRAGETSEVRLQLRVGVAKFSAEPKPVVTEERDFGVKRPAPATASTSQVSPPAVSEERNFGIVVSELNGRREHVSVNGQQVTKEAAKQLLESGTLSDDSGKLRLTVIGPEAERKKVLDDLKGPLAEHADALVTQSYPPDHWSVSKAGFHTGGSPTIYVQEPSGKVLHRQDDYADGAAGLGQALAAIRKPDPSYDKAKDFDLRKSPELTTWLILGVAAFLVLLGLRKAHP